MSRLPPRPDSQHGERCQEPAEPRAGQRTCVVPREPVLRAQPPSRPWTRAWPRAQPQQLALQCLWPPPFKQQRQPRPCGRPPLGAPVPPRCAPPVPAAAVTPSPGQAPAAVASDTLSRSWSRPAHRGCSSPRCPRRPRQASGGSGRSQAVQIQGTWETQNTSPLPGWRPRAAGRGDRRSSRPVAGPAGPAPRGLRAQQVPALVPTVTGSGPGSCRRQLSAVLFAVNDAFSQTACGLGRAGQARGSGSQPNGPLPTPCWPARARGTPGNGDRRGLGLRAAYGPLVQP